MIGIKGFDFYEWNSESKIVTEVLDDGFPSKEIPLLIILGNTMLTV